MPSVATLGNLVAGIMACGLAVEGYPVGAAFSIVLAVVLDYLDGSLARRLGVSSDFGRELDSLADMVSFGVAPAILVGSVMPEGPNFLWVRWTLIACFPLCAAWRLARFAVPKLGESCGHGAFSGLPSTGAGGAAAAAVLLYVGLAPEGYGAAVHLLPGLMVLLGFLMISEFPYTHMGTVVGRLPRPVAVCATLVLGLICMLWRYELVLGVLFWSYVLSGPVADRLTALHHARTG